MAVGDWIRAAVRFGVSDAPRLSELSGCGTSVGVRDRISGESRDIDVVAVRRCRRASRPSKGVQCGVVAAAGPGAGAVLDRGQVARRRC